MTIARSCVMSTHAVPSSGRRNGDAAKNTSVAASPARAPSPRRFIQDTCGCVSSTIATGNTREVYEALHAYEADLGIIGDAEAGPAFETVSLSQTPILAFVGRDHPLVGRAEVDFATLARQSLVMREEGSNTRARVLAAAERQGIALEPAIGAQGREAVRELVRSGAGVGFVSASEFDDDPRLCALAIRDAGAAEMAETLICLRERSKGPTVAAFLETARLVIGDTGALASTLASL